MSKRDITDIPDFLWTNEKKIEYFKNLKPTPENPKLKMRPVTLKELEDWLKKVKNNE